MAGEGKKEIALEVGHVLFIDIVGYSKLLIDEQAEALEELNRVVRNTEVFHAADAARNLICLPTGDGMALVFTSNAGAPVECALQITKALKSHPDLVVRMGIHSGPVHEVSDVNQRKNIAGAGIDISQRVMDCGDAGHILLSKHVAEDLEQYRQWRPHLHDLGECEVKHGVKLSVVNFYTDDAGNSAVPEKFKSVIETKAAPISRSRVLPRDLKWLLIGPMGLGLAAFVIGLVIFRLVGPDRWADRANFAQEQGRPGGASLPTTEKSIAVLPFENLSDEKQNAYFADGVQDEILTNLAKIADLKVISRTSVMPYKSGLARNLSDIARQLGVSHLVEGSVQRSANRVRVNAQLIDARNDAHLWAETYDRDLADVFAIQSEIAKMIADQLRAKILPQEKQAIERQPTRDVAAYDLYVRGIQALDAAPNSQHAKENFLQAIDLLEQAIARDPSFLNARCKLAQAHDQFYLLGGDHTAQRLALAENVVNAALRLQPDAPEAHLARAGHLYSKLDYDGARAELDIVRRTLPNDPRAFEWSGYIDRRQGRRAESARNLERALELDPQNFVLLSQIALSYEFLGEYSKDVAVLERALALRPNDFDTRISRAQLEVYWKADPRPLHALIESAIQENPRSRAALAPIRTFLAFAERDADGGEQAVADLGEKTFGPDAFQFPPAFGAALFARLKGDPVAAQASFERARALQEKIVEAQPAYGPTVCILGLIDAALGRKEDAIREGRRAAELMPPSKDSINGAHIMQYLAMIYAWVGEKDLAIDKLTRALQIPGRSTYGQLRLFPHWDPLRSDPRFEKIVASLAPKDAK